MKVAARRGLLILLGLSALARSQISQAKDLAGHVGFGVANVGVGSIPSLSADWQVTSASAFEFDLGIDTETDNNQFLLGTRYFRHIYLEENTIFSAVVGGGLLTDEVSGSSKSGYFLELGGGAKFFPPGAPNFALGFVGTIGVKSAGSVSFLTRALFSAHYYF